jgi:hypothetical protein
MDLIFSEYVTANKEAFLAKVKQVASNLGIDPNALMAVMYKESRLNPAAVNQISGATGLIQFMPSTANGLGTTTGALRLMSNLQQLDYVERYLRPYTSKMKTAIDVYFAVFFPAAIGWPLNKVLQTSSLSSGLIASQNSGIDKNKDSKITVGEVQEWFLRGLPQSVQDVLQKKNQPNDANTTDYIFDCPHCGGNLLVSKIS